MSEIADLLEDAASEWDDTLASLPWAREVPEALWAPTNLDRYSAVELLMIVGRSGQ